MARGMRWVSGSRSSPTSPSGSAPAALKYLSANGLETVGAGVVRQHPLDHEFGGAIGINRLLRRRLANRNLLRFAVDGAGAREHDGGGVGVEHRPQQREGAGDVVVVIFLGVDHRFPDIGAGREVQHGRDIVGEHRLAQRGVVTDVGLDQRPPAHEAFVAGREVVVDKGREASFGEGLAGVRPDITGPAGDEDIP